MKRLKFVTTKKGTKKIAHAWKIIDGIENFRKTPLTVFSTRAKLKMDCESLPRLQAAMEKFGGTAQQLKIANDFLVARLGPVRTGAFDPTTGEIKLANRSLAVLAHEGLHKLKARGVIPTQDYRALVQAGKRIVLSQPDEFAYINQKDSQNNLVYPPGKTRNEEYAAVFVETYYENDQLARKNLMGYKLTRVEKVLNYFKEVKDIVQARLGLPAAVAREFLRKVERDCYSARPQGPRRKQLMSSGYNLSPSSY